MTESYTEFINKMLLIMLSKYKGNVLRIDQLQLCANNHNQISTCLLNYKSATIDNQSNYFAMFQVIMHRFCLLLRRFNVEYF